MADIQSRTFKVETLPTSGYVVGGIYFVDSENKIYVRTETGWDVYDHASETTHATKADSATSATKADTAAKVTNKLTAGSKTYDGSAAVSLTKADLGLGNVDNISVVNYTEARGDNLITNGNGIMGNNYNFSRLVFDPLVTNNCKGSFRSDGQIQVNITEKLTLDFNSKYSFSCDVKIDNPDVARILYIYINCYDTDGFEISPSFTYAHPGSTTTLAKDLKNGDTIVYLTSTAGFTAESVSWRHGFIFWNYKDSLGYEYGETYSRNRWDNLWTATDTSFKDDTANTITLNSAWTHGEFKAGTKVSQCDSGATYEYILSPTTTEAYKDWTHLSTTFGSDRLRTATRKISMGFLCQWPSNGSDVSGKHMWLANVNLSKVILQDDTAFVKTSGNSIINDGSLGIRNNATEYPLRFNSLNGQSTYIDFMCDGVRYNALGVKNKTNDLLWNGNRVTTVLDLANKVDKVSGKQLSTNDYTTAEKNKLAGLSNAEALTNDEIDEAIK